MAVNAERISSPIKSQKSEVNKKSPIKSSSKQIDPRDSSQSSQVVLKRASRSRKKVIDEDMEILDESSQPSKKRKMVEDGPTPSKKRKLVEDKKSFFKNRSSQGTDRNLDLPEGVSRGMKIVKIDNVGLGSRRILEEKS